jgi:hypothetical protein
MTLPVLSAMIIVFIVWLQYEIRINNRHVKKSNDTFWRQEKESNFVRRKDITNLKYITVQTEQLPVKDHADSTVNSYRDTILKLSGKKVLNLSGYTNTELKLKYGASNLNLLSEYDSNYILLVSILQKWAERLYQYGSIADSLSVLEYAVSIPTDVTKTYTLLSDIYKSTGAAFKIDTLIHILHDTNIRNKEKLIDELAAIRDS